MAPAYPGITDSPTLDDWDPPFPVDLRRVRRVDEQYWEKYPARRRKPSFASKTGSGSGDALWDT